VIRATVTLALALTLLGASAARAASLQPIGKFDQPIYLTSDPGNGNRLFVVERAGRIVQVKGGAVSTFADISSIVSCCEPNSERGLLSIALAPDFDSSGRLFVDYTGKEEPGEIHVAELRASGGTAPLSSLRNLLTIAHPNHSNHYGGQLQFGPEGDLFISTGDGGGSNDSEHNAQDLGSLLGKILRINPDPSGVLPYTVPAGNPFPAAVGPANTIWSYGLRNPFRFSFDRLPGDMVIGDVGQGAREEVDHAPMPSLGRGANYGWNCFEGSIAGPATDPGCAGSEESDFVSPAFDYPHNPSCAIIGGYVVRDASLGNLYGRYLYGDLCTGEIRSLSLGGPAVGDRSENLEVEDLNSFGEDACGRLYAISGGGTVSRFVGATAASCPEPADLSAARAATFVGLRAQSRRVERNRRAMITAFVSPCGGRKGEPVKLLRGGRHVATRRLDRACTVHFRPRISRGAGFRATIGENTASLAGFSRQLRIRIKPRHHGKR
jgi:glucose/arabinose dehydrogenase